MPWYLALEPSHKLRSKDVGYVKQVLEKLQKAPHVIDVNGVRRIVHLYGSTASWASHAKKNAQHWDKFVQNHQVAHLEAHAQIELEGYVNPQTGSAAYTVFAPTHCLEADEFQVDIGGPISPEDARSIIEQYPQPYFTTQLPYRQRLGWDRIDNPSHIQETLDPDTPHRAIYTTPRNTMAPAAKKVQRGRGSSNAAPTTVAPKGKAHQVIQSENEIESLAVLVLVVKNIDGHPDLFEEITINCPDNELLKF